MVNELKSISFEPGTPSQQGTVPLCVPHLGGNELQYLRECIETGWVSSAGPFVDMLEETVAGICQQSYGVATCSGTAALHLALLVAGVEPGDEVLVSDLTFIAPVNAIHYAGAHPVLVDASLENWQMDVEKACSFLQSACQMDSEGRLFNRQSGRKVGAILPVHILGGAVPLAPLLKVAQELGIPVIEDATEGLGARYRGEPLGSFGDIACLSFNGNKIVTAGGGGALVTNNKAWADRARYLSTQAKDDPLYYRHQAVGYNYRLTNIQAAVGVAQLEQLNDFVSRKRQIAENYNQTLQPCDSVTILPALADVEQTYWMYTICLKGKHIDARDSFLKTLIHNQIQCRPIWEPIHQSGPYAKCQRLLHSEPRSVLLARTSISLPCSVGLTNAQQQHTLEVLMGLLAS